MGYSKDGNLVYGFSEGRALSKDPVKTVNHPKYRVPVRSYSYCSLQEIFSRNVLINITKSSGGTIPGYWGLDPTGCFKTIVKNSSPEVNSHREVITLI